MLMYTGGRRYTLTNHETEKMVWSIERSRTSLNCAVEVGLPQIEMWRYPLPMQREENKTPAR